MNDIQTFLLLPLLAPLYLLNSVLKGSPFMGTPLPGPL